VIHFEEAKDDSSEEFVCSACGKEIEGDFDFCPYCGAIFSEDIVCGKHRHAEADAEIAKSRLDDAGLHPVLCIREDRKREDMSSMNLTITVRSSIQVRLK